MPIEARLTILQPDSLAVVAKEFGSEPNKGGFCDLIGDNWNFIQFEICIRGRGCVYQRGYHRRYIRLR